MLTLFRTNQPLANIFLLVYLALLRASTVLHPTVILTKPQGILTQWMYNELPPNSFGAYVAAFFLVFIQAVFINITIARFRVATETTLFPGLFYCLITSMMPEFLTLSPILLANTFLIMGMYHFFDVYKNNYASSGIFDAGLWLGTASLFHFSFVLFLFWGILGLGILRGIRPKEFFMFFIGFLVSFFLLGSYLFWIGKLPLLGQHLTANFGFLSFTRHTDLTVNVKIAVMGILVLITLLGSTQLFSRRSIATHKLLTLLFWMLLISGVTVFIQSGVDLNHWLIAAIPLSILLSMLFQRVGVATAEVLHMLLLAAALILQFEYLLIV